MYTDAHIPTTCLPQTVDPKFDEAERVLSLEAFIWFAYLIFSSYSSVSLHVLLYSSAFFHIPQYSSVNLSILFVYLMQ